MSRQPSYDDVRPIIDLVTDEECYESMMGMDLIADDYGEAEKDLFLAKEHLKMAEAAGILVSDEKNAVRQQADARVSPHYLRNVMSVAEATGRLKTIEVKYAALKVRIEIYRTIHADKRAREIPEPGRR